MEIDDNPFGRAEKVGVGTQQCFNLGKICTEGNILPVPAMQGRLMRTVVHIDNVTQDDTCTVRQLYGAYFFNLCKINAVKHCPDPVFAERFVQIIAGIYFVALDKDILEKAEKALENALRDFDGNYTEEEKRDLEGKLETVKAALAAIEKAEKEAKDPNKNSKLPSGKEAGSSRKGEADSFRKGAVDSSTIGKAESVRTGDTGNLTLWIALLFISGGIAAGTVAAGKKKKYSVK